VDLLSDYPPVTRGTVVVWGLLASYPFGGMTWQVTHYLAGLRRLGFDVWYVEDSDRSLLDPDTLWHTADYAGNVSYLARQMESVALGDRWVFRPPRQPDNCLGATDREGLARLYAGADAILNLCGAHYLRPEHMDLRSLIYVQTDPFDDQVRVAKNDTWLIAQFDAYHSLFTYGENLGAPDCLVPVERHRWLPTRPPVCVDWWSSPSDPCPEAALTTISSWKKLKKGRSWQGERYHWRKDLEFRRFMELPRRSRLPLELALEGIGAREADEFRQHGWRVVPARDLADPVCYRRYIRDSLGEFTVAKEQYVRPRTGWFSDRSVCYLAAGRPVITQDTAFGKFVPTGRGLFAFQTMDDVVAAIDAISTDYDSHSRAAREIAGEYFAAEKVIASMMERIGL
jgi:hypothetical protein